MADETRSQVEYDKLAAIPAKYAVPPAHLTAKLPKPTKKDNQKGHCNECGGWHGLPAVHLDYMGHADVTLALIEIDPMFDYGWLTDENGAMLIRQVGNRLVLEGWLQVHGQTRRCVGTCEANKFEPEKELIGDLLRNGAMRFGVATALWSKSDGHESQERDDVPSGPTSEQIEIAETWELVKAQAGTPVAESLKALAENESRKLTEKALADDADWRTMVREFIAAFGMETPSADVDSERAAEASAEQGELIAEGSAS